MAEEVGKTESKGAERHRPANSVQITIVAVFSICSLLLLGDAL